MRRIREGKRSNGSAWWSQEIRWMDENKKEGSLKWRRTGSEEDLEEYRRVKGELKGYWER